MPRLNNQSEAFLLKRDVAFYADPILTPVTILPPGNDVPV